MRLLLGNNEFIDPTQIEDAVAMGGYEALAKAVLKMTPEEVISEIKASRLRGRGGAGYLTGRKWESCRQAAGEPKYVISTAMRGTREPSWTEACWKETPFHPRRHVDRSYAIEASRGFIYVRHEYPFGPSPCQSKSPRPGKPVCWEEYPRTGLEFDVETPRGEGPLVCGESTALIASIEARTGEPRSKQIHTSAQGLWGKPRTINNVGPGQCAPHYQRGSQWFSSIGTPESKGTKIFSWWEKLKNTGLSGSMGITLPGDHLRTSAGGRKTKRDQGGADGGAFGRVYPRVLLPPSGRLREPDPGRVHDGPGGPDRHGEGTCMVDVAKYFVHFLEEESCGKCLPCREGLKRMGQIWTGSPKERAIPGPSPPGRISPGRGPTPPSAGWGNRPKSRPFRAEIFPDGVRGSYPWAEMPPRSMPSAHPLFHIPGGTARDAEPQESLPGPGHPKGPGKPHQILMDRCSRCGPARTYVRAMPFGPIKRRRK